ncbi:hypothetical protein Nepgr_015637 [Nepenthes gracilis]|uniref:Uncharacterized protein n=1 Tax=Nepenthes gracilis TaxID=150966 RepID=A0AAD3SNZ2_NEPGR|nr:hypothetical protein Nepgr_015637 [Nepenthes gracilis]
MRTGGTFNTALAVSPSQPQLQTTKHSPLNSPVPNLFGGLAAMLGLTAFALLILGCSYWKLSGYLDSNDADMDVEASADAKANDGLKLLENM